MGAMKEQMDLTWEIARKLINLTEEQREEIFGYSNVDRIIKNYSANETNFKIVEYEKKCEEEKIVVGEIVGCNFICNGIVIYIDYDERDRATYHVLFSDGGYNTFCRKELTKTGKKVDILQILSNLINQ